MKVLITGSSGLIGTALSKSLTAEGHSAIRLQRQNNDPDSPIWDPDNCLKDLAWVGKSMQSFIWQVKTLQTVVGVKQRKTVS
jgi:Nucleoside-diphosphate-sugar epimerases